MRIALDLDGVCYAWDKTARYMLRKKIAATGQVIPPELFRDSQHWNEIEEVVGPENFQWLWTDGVRDGLFRYGHCYTGAIEGVTELCEMGDVHIVTARPKTAYKDTIDWLSFMFDKSTISGVHFTGGESKSSVPADVYIDDAPHNIEQLLKAGHQVVSVLRPWNQSLGSREAETWPGIVRATRSLLLATV